MATHSSILAWRIAWTEEPGGLQSMGLQRVRHNGATNTTTTHVHVQNDGSVRLFTVVQFGLAQVENHQWCLPQAEFFN